MMEDEENKKEIKEIEVEGKIKLVTNSMENSRNEIDLQTKPDDKPDFAYKSTIDEPILTTLMRDLKMVFYKLKYVLLPKMREEQGKELRKWDLWGPMVLCLLLALTLSITSSQDSSLIFATIFFIYWIGGAVVTINAKFLRGKISFFQTICVLGYCVCPINIAALLLATMQNIMPIWIKIIIVILALVWSILSSVAFMSSLVEDRKKILAVYPVVLFYLFLGWYTLTTT